MIANVRDLQDLVSLAVRMRRAQIESSGRYHAAAYARKRELEDRFDQAARAVLGVAGEVRQPGSISPPEGARHGERG